MVPEHERGDIFHRAESSRELWRLSIKLRTVTRLSGPPSGSRPEIGDPQKLRRPSLPMLTAMPMT